MDHLCHLHLVFVKLSCLFISALWSPAEKGLTPWLSFYDVLLCFSVRCGTRLYRFLIFATFLTLLT